MSTTFEPAYAQIEQQALASIKEAQQFTLDLAKLLANAPAVRALKALPAPQDVIDAAFATTGKVIELQREFVSRWAETVSA